MEDRSVNIFKKIRQLLCVRTTARFCLLNSQLLAKISVTYWIEVCLNQKLASSTNAFCFFFFFGRRANMSCDTNYTLNYMLRMRISQY